MDRAEQLKRDIEYLIEQIDHNISLIESDCEEQGGHMGTVPYTKLKIYKEIRESLEEILNER